MKVNNLKKLLNNDKFWIPWLHIIAPDAKKDSTHHRMSILFRGAPKLRAWLRNMKTQVSVRSVEAFSDLPLGRFSANTQSYMRTIAQVLRDKHKQMVFFQYPASCAITYAIQGELGVECAMIMTGMKTKERDLILPHFKYREDRVMVLLTTSEASGTGINAQCKCFHLYIVETPFNEAMRTQMIVQLWRTGFSQSFFKVYEYCFYIYIHSSLTFP